jgi:hypothetical protein
VAKKNIWDHAKGRIGPQGGIDWYGSRLAEPDVLVEELADIFYPALKVKGSIPKFWWQNVYTEVMCDPGASTYKTREAHAKECVDVNAPFAPKRKTTCKEVRIDMQSRLPFKAISFPGDLPVATDEQGCDTTGATDYFPVKVSPQHSHHWDVEYRKWYKVATYTYDWKTHRYVLTRKGCPTPDVTADVFITLPVSSAGFSSSTYHAFMEVMGSRAAVKAVNGGYPTLPCLNQIFFLESIFTD